MDRLTKNARIYGNEKMFILNENINKQEAVNKLGEFEDLMEKYPQITNIDKLDRCLGDYLNVDSDTLSGKIIKHLQQENTELKKKLEYMVLDWESNAIGKVCNEIREKDNKITVLGKDCKDWQKQAFDFQTDLIITEKALELACKSVNEKYAKPFGNNVNYVDYFKQQAKKELEVK